MKRAISSKNKISFINGKLPQPSTIDNDFDLWEHCNSMVVSWITRTLSPHISQSTICNDSAFNQWNGLRERFTKGNHFRFSDLLRDLHSIKQGERSLSAYFMDMKIIWDEFDDLRPTPSCTCSTPCSCKLSSVVCTYKHDEYVICFLKGLNDSYQYVRSQILLMDPLPSITKVYSLVIQQDITHIPTHNDSTICAVNSTNFG
ncbi:uncharacterized protein [Cicer arietinum]|uniref:uncharacterized protein n=1 Tax=Cicer arietinum TaxID=3827 RepID=UPI003CC638EC